MNGTKVRHIDLIADGHKTVKLQCFVDGLPKPTVDWYKVQYRYLYFIHMIIFCFDKTQYIIISHLPGQYIVKRK